MSGHRATDTKHPEHKCLAIYQDYSNAWYLISVCFFVYSSGHRVLVSFYAPSSPVPVQCHHLYSPLLMKYEVHLSLPMKSSHMSKCNSLTACYLMKLAVRATVPWVYVFFFNTCVLDKLSLKWFCYSDILYLTSHVYSVTAVNQWRQSSGSRKHYSIQLNSRSLIFYPCSLFFSLSLSLFLACPALVSLTFHFSLETVNWLRCTLIQQQQQQPRQQQQQYLF